MSRYYRAKYKPSANEGANETGAVYGAYSTDPDQIWNFTSVPAGTKIAGYEVWFDDPYEVTAAPVDVLLAQVFADNGDAANDTSKTFDYPTGMVSGNKVLVVVSNSASGTGLGGTKTVPALWGSVLFSANDGDATARGNLVIYAFEVDDWVTAGSPTTFTLTSASNCMMCVGFVEWTPLTGTVEAVYATGNDPATITPAGGTASYAFVAVATRSQDNSGASGAPSGYSNLTTCNTGDIGNNNVERSMSIAVKIATQASEDPGTFTASVGSARMTAAIALG
jgi:hypothetical protein